MLRFFLVFYRILKHGECKFYSRNNAKNFRFLGLVAGIIFSLSLSLFSASVMAATPVMTSNGSISAALPVALYTRAVMDEVELDSEFDYKSLGRINNLQIFPFGYRSIKGLVDKVVVYKMRHQMLLLKKDKIVRSYWIALSDRPQGHKVQRGDRRTPEGLYTLDYVKENSSYHRAFHISYPNMKDLEEARYLGVDPGGMIMVHGQPPVNSEYHETVQRSDWTNGCIALLNPEMDEFISLVDPGTTIEILP